MLRLTDEILAQAPSPDRLNLWQPLTVSELRATQREARPASSPPPSACPERPDTWTARIDRVVLHPNRRTCDPAAAAVRDVPGPFSPGRSR